jgi:hypothetical protein
MLRFLINYIIDAFADADMPPYVTATGRVPATNAISA